MEGLTLASFEAGRAARRLGWSAGLGLAALALAAAAAWQSNVQLTRQHSLQEQIRSMRSAPPRPSAAPLTAQAQIDAFRAYLPAYTAIPEQLKLLVKVADKHSLSLARADYKVQADEGVDFLRYQIALPVKANYEQVQAFLLGALQALPSLSLESVVFKRASASSDDIEARIVFVLLAKKPVAKGTRP